jgi:hypothetical protein
MYNIIKHNRKSDTEGEQPAKHKIKIYKHYISVSHITRCNKFITQQEDRQEKASTKLS